MKNTIIGFVLILVGIGLSLAAMKLKLSYMRGALLGSIGGALIGLGILFLKAKPQDKDQ